MKILYQPRTPDILLSNVFAALSDPTRLHIVRLLLRTPELTCGDFEIAGAKSTLSHHFKTLREAGVTSTRVEGVQHFISLRRDDLDARFPGLLATLTRAEEPF